MIIGVCGNKFSGKDTIANYLVDNYKYKRYAFADPLKDICRILFEFNEEQLYGNKKEILDEFWEKTPREIFQMIGTDLFRNYLSQNFWVNVLERKIKDKEMIVISDVRFENEAEMIRRLDGIIIKVVRNNSIIDTHESESYIEQIECDITITNDTTKKELYSKIDEYLNLKKTSLIENYDIIKRQNLISFNKMLILCLTIYSFSKMLYIL